MARAVLIVLDSVGIGELPDAAEFGDEGTNTIRHVDEHSEYEEAGAFQYQRYRTCTGERPDRMLRESG